MLGQERRRRGGRRIDRQEAVDELFAHGQARPTNRINKSTEELEFDARNFSYPIALQLAFLDDIAATTIAKCHRLRDSEDTFRDHFVTSTPVGP